MIPNDAWVKIVGRSNEHQLIVGSIAKVRTFVDPRIHQGKGYDLYIVEGKDTYGFTFIYPVRDYDMEVL